MTHYRLADGRFWRSPASIIEHWILNESSLNARGSTTPMITNRRVFHDQKRSKVYRDADEAAVVTEGHQHLANILKELSCSFGHEVTVLDLGCGTGRYFHCLGNAKRLTGVDISLHMLKEARSPVRRGQISCRRIDLICGDIFEVAIVPESFDFIYSIGVFLGHSSFGPRIGDQLLNLLRPGGKIFFTFADIGSRAAHGTYTRLREVMEQSRFARHEISSYSDASTPEEVVFYECIATKDQNGSCGGSTSESSAVSDDDVRSGDMVWRNASLIASEISTLIAPGDSLILVDGGAFGKELVIECRVIPFIEREGQYWGPPPDDVSAIQELERLRQSGASFIVFTWLAFWWLDCYSGFHNYICSRFGCVLRNERVVVFDLRV